MYERPDTILLTWPNPALRGALAGVRVIEATDASSLDHQDCLSIRVILTTGIQSIGKREMDDLPNLGLIVTVGAGFEGVDLQAARSREIGLATGSGANAGAVAEMAIGLFLAAARRIVSNDARVRQGNWQKSELRPVRAIGAMRVGIVGMGAIGKAIAARLDAFKCDIVWTGPRPKPEVAYRYVPGLLDLARESDVLIVAAPLNAATANLINAEVIAALGSDGLIVNIGRGGLVDEDALIAALREGRLGSAALDVFLEEPSPPERWHHVPNVVLSPHTAGVTHESMAAILALAANRAIEFLAQAPARA